MNYGTPAKPERDAALIRDYLKAPTTLNALGAKYGISRERARQVLVKNNIAFRHPRLGAERRFDHEAIAGRYQTTCLTMSQVAKEFGCSVSLVVAVLREHGIETEVRYFPPPVINDPNLAEEMYEAGKTCAQIADHFGCCMNRVSQILRGRGVAMRGPGRFGPKTPWTQDEIDSMLAMWHDGMTQTAIGRASGRGQSNVSQKLAQLRKKGVIV